MVFDYWRDPCSSDDDMPAFLDTLDPDKPLYVFVSHSHKDHFNRAVFGWASRFGRVHYLLSRETERRCRYITSPTSVYAGPKVSPDAVTGMRRGDTWSDGVINVRACGSTDIGVSWLVESQGELLFHAGDLNAWIWRAVSTPGQIRHEWNEFTGILDEIVEAAAGRNVKIAFFPVDSRIGEGYHLGAREFVGRVAPDCFIPMHYGLGNEEEQCQRQTDAADVSLYLTGGKTVSPGVLNAGESMHI